MRRLGFGRRVTEADGRAFWGGGKSYVSGALIEVLHQMNSSEKHGYGFATGVTLCAIDAHATS